MAQRQIGACTALTVHLLCSIGLFSANLLAAKLYHWSLVTHPAQMLRIVTLVEALVVIPTYSCLRRNPQNCSWWKAIGRGLIGLPIGALLNAFGAVVLGAPVGFKYWTSTFYWSLLMSLLTFVPAVCVFGSSKTDWHRILACSKSMEGADYMVSIPAHGAIIGAWFGAWPMPLDWERPWQLTYAPQDLSAKAAVFTPEWPICVTYGAISGYLIGMLISLLFIIKFRSLAQVKGD